MRGPGNSFDHMSGIGWRMPRVSARWLPFWRVCYAVLAAWRRVRVTPALTHVLGPQYKRSRDLLEIDITYTCNLGCLNCNRSIGHAAEALHLDVALLRRHVDSWIAEAKRWRRIRVLGGEPTLHPEFEAIIDELRRYREWHPDCIVEVVTNGLGKVVNEKLAHLPDDVWIDNSQKSGPINPDFRPFTTAPVDDPGLRGADARNACAVTRDCGMGLTPSGYYPCAVAGGIDRILGEGLGQSTLPSDDDDMLDAAGRLCSLCGRFRDGHFIPRLLRAPLVTEDVSPTWTRMYADWRARRAAAAARLTPRPADEGEPES